MGKRLRQGYTTGACAAAAARAAVKALGSKGGPENTVRITLPQGQEIELPVTVHRGEGWAEATVIKDAGDDPDITHGVAVKVKARLQESGLTLRAGEGVGIVTRPGLAVPVGEPAINPGPRAMIREAVKDLIPPGRGVELIFSIPGGEELARRTLNPHLGIEGGLSILGTTGIVQPMSEEALRESLLPQIDVARAAGYDTLLLTPGRVGRRHAVEGYGLPAGVVILTSNFIGYILEACAERGVRRILLWGHAGKLVKLAGGIFYTHSRIADARREIVAAHAAAWGASPEVVQAMLTATTVEAIFTILEQTFERERYFAFWHHLAELASKRARELVHGALEVGTAFLDLQGRIMGQDGRARAILGEWRNGSKG